MNNKEAQKMAVEEVLDLFKKKIYSKGGRITFKYKSRNKLIGVLDYPAVKVCEVEFFKMVHNYDEYCIVIKGIPPITGTQIFVIRPSMSLNIDIAKKTKEDIERVYNIGVKDASRLMSDLKNYLKKGD